MRLFQPLSLFHLGLFRFLLGLCLLCYLVMLFPDRHAFFSTEGILPSDFLARHYPSSAANIHRAMVSDFYLTCLFASHLLLAALFTVGFKTRWTTGAVVLLQISLLNANPLIPYVGIQYLQWLLVWCLLLPVGQSFSVDSFIGSKKIGFDRGEQVDNWTTRLFSLQILIVYFFSAVEKSGGAWWPHGTALYDAFGIFEFQTALSRGLLQFPQLLRWATYSSWLFELIIPFGLLVKNRKVRWAVVISLVGFHLSTFFTLNIGLIPLISIFALVALTPPPTGSRLVAAPNWGPAAVVYFFLVLISNISDLAYSSDSERNPIQKFLSGTQLFQSWDIFAPVPFKTSGRFIFEVEQESSEKLEYVPDQDSLIPPRTDEFNEAPYRTIFWTSLFIRLRLLDLKMNTTRLFTDYICRQIRSRMPSPRQVNAEFLLYIHKDGEPRLGPIPKTLYQNRCNNE